MGTVQPASGKEALSLGKLFLLISLRQASGALNLSAGLEAAFAAGADPVHGVGSFGDKASLSAPGDNKLAGPPATCDAMHHHGLFGGVVLVHEREELCDLFLGGHSVIRHMDEVVVEALGDILSVVELADIDHGLDAFIVEEVEDVRVWPPRGGDHSFDNPSEGLCPFWLSAFWPIPRSNGHGEVWHFCDWKQFLTRE